MPAEWYPHSDVLKPYKEKKMKVNGKVISKDEYVALLTDLVPMKTVDREKLKKGVYDALGREIQNPTPIFINDPDDLAKPMTINGKVLRILRQRQMDYLEKHLEETPEDMENFGTDEEIEMQTPAQVIELEDPDFSDLQDSKSESEGSESEGINSDKESDSKASESDGDAPSDESADSK